MSLIWITGLPGVGKTTVATCVVAALRARGESCLLLDGDALRAALADITAGSARASRLQFARTYGRLADLVCAQGLTAVVATVSLFHEVHARNRTALGRYLEVHLVCDEGERLRRRHARGATAAADAVADDPVEWPLAPDLELASDVDSVPAMAERIVARWFERDGR